MNLLNLAIELDAGIDNYTGTTQDNPEITMHLDKLEVFVKLAIEDYKASLVPVDWISVKDSLPDNPYRKQIIWIGRLNYQPPYVGMGVYRDGGWDYPFSNDHEEVTHWHLLPEPPSRETK